jgi:hypothetical protein
MAGCLLPKRLLEVSEEEDSQGDYHRSYLKKPKHDVYAASVPVSRSFSRSSYGRDSSVKILNDQVQQMFVSPEQRMTELLQRNCKLPTSYSWAFSNDMRRPSALDKSAKHLLLSFTSNIILLLNC